MRGSVLDVSTPAGAAAHLTNAIARNYAIRSPEVADQRRACGRGSEVVPVEVIESWLESLLPWPRPGTPRPVATDLKYEVLGSWREVERSTRYDGFEDAPRELVRFLNRDRMHREERWQCVVTVVDEFLSRSAVASCTGVKDQKEVMALAAMPLSDFLSAWSWQDEGAPSDALLLKPFFEAGYLVAECKKGQFPAGTLLVF